jgi:Na+-transporting methylmalonyl-CoA/oxaloacetate decarboxylase beta subunit
MKEIAIQKTLCFISLFILPAVDQMTAINEVIKFPTYILLGSLATLGIYSWIRDEYNYRKWKKEGFNPLNKTKYRIK